MDDTRRKSYKRSLAKLIKWNLVKPSVFRMRRGWRGYALTDMGAEEPRKIKAEITSFMKDYANFV